MQANDPYRFYDPLRNTLDRSSARWNNDHQRNFQKSRSIDQSVGLSRLSKKRRELSPQQAYEIKKSTLIPIDKDLVMTNNFEKIHGKEFSVVGIQVKEGMPIPIQQFRKQYKRGPLHQQTIYELHSKTDQISFKNSSFKYPPNQQTHEYYKMEPTPTQSETKISSPVLLREHPSQLRVQSPTPSLSTNKSDMQKQYKANLEKGLGSIDTSNLTLMRSSEPKKQYKYNLFSALDEAINTNCSSCGGNEIIATKQYSNWQ